MAPLNDFDNVESCGKSSAGSSSEGAVPSNTVVSSNTPLGIQVSYRDGKIFIGDKEADFSFYPKKETKKVERPLTPISAEVNRRRKKGQTTLEAYQDFYKIMIPIYREHWAEIDEDNWQGVATYEEKYAKNTLWDDASSEARTFRSSTPNPTDNDSMESNELSTSVSFSDSDAVPNRKKEVRRKAPVDRYTKKIVKSSKKNSVLPEKTNNQNIKYTKKILNTSPHNSALPDKMFTANTLSDESDVEEPERIKRYTKKILTNSSRNEKKSSQSKVTHDDTLSDCEYIKFTRKFVPGSQHYVPEAERSVSTLRMNVCHKCEAAVTSSDSDHQSFSDEDTKQRSTKSSTGLKYTFLKKLLMKPPKSDE